MCGQAESIFKDLKYYLPTGCSIKDANIMGILDPPRAGIPDKAIVGCRKVLFFCNNFFYKIYVFQSLNN